MRLKICPGCYFQHCVSGRYFLSYWGEPVESRVANTNEEIDKLCLSYDKIFPQLDELHFIT